MGTTAVCKPLVEDEHADVVAGGIVLRHLSDAEAAAAALAGAAVLRGVCTALELEQSLLDDGPDVLLERLARTGIQPLRWQRVVKGRS
jgi:hypothetical protein